MKLFARFSRAARAFWEGARQRIGIERLRTTYQDQFRDYGSATREILQSKSRYFYNNSPLLSRLCDLFEIYTVGCGLTVYPDSSDEAYNKASRVVFHEWQRSPDISSWQTFGMMQGLVANNYFVDGEAFALKVQLEGKPKLQLIEAHRVATPPERKNDEGITVVDGIERDFSTGRPTGYWIYTIGRNNERIWRLEPADKVIHIFEPSRPNQYRGVPFAASALNTLQDVETLERLEMKAARSNSLTANVLTTGSGEVDPDDVIRTGGAVTTGTNGSVSAVEERVGGETIVLKPGEDFKAWNANRPSVVTMEYWKQLHERICMGVGIPYVMAIPERTQGTVYRGALDGATAFFNARSEVMQEFVREVFLWVIDSLRTRVESISNPPPDGSWNRVKIYAPRAPNVDVGRNSSAMLAELAAGATTYSDVYGPLGQHWEEQFEEIAKQRKKAKELGILQAQP